MKVHEAIIAVGGYTAAGVTVIGVLLLHIRRIVIEFKNGNDKDDKE